MANMSTNQERSIVALRLTNMPVSDGSYCSVVKHGVVHIHVDLSISIVMTDGS